MSLSHERLTVPTVIYQHGPRLQNLRVDFHRTFRHRADVVVGRPEGEEVVVGQATVNHVGANTLLNQHSERAAINWQTFDIDAAEAVRFAQPSTGSITSNRVLSQNPTAIEGQLSANGQVFILNPNGVLFGRGAQVNLGGLAASTLSLSNDDFRAGHNPF